MIDVRHRWTLRKAHLADVRVQVRLSLQSNLIRFGLSGRPSMSLRLSLHLGSLLDELLLLRLGNGVRRHHSIRTSIASVLTRLCLFHPNRTRHLLLRHALIVAGWNHELSSILGPQCFRLLLANDLIDVTHQRRIESLIRVHSPKLLCLPIHGILRARPCLLWQDTGSRGQGCHPTAHTSVRLRVGHLCLHPRFVHSDLPSGFSSQTVVERIDFLSCEFLQQVRGDILHICPLLQFGPRCALKHPVHHHVNLMIFLRREGVRVVTCCLWMPRSLHIRLLLLRHLT